MKRRLLLVIGLSMAMVVQFGAHPEAAEGEPELTKLQIRISTTSDWTAVRLTDLDLRVRNTVTEASIDELWEHADGWTVVNDGGTADVVVEVVADLQRSAVPRLAVTKGYEGETRVEVLETNGSAPRTVSQAILDTHDARHNALTRDLDPALIIGSGLSLPEIDERDLTLAFYYPWFERSAPSDRRVAPDKPASSYTTDDPAHIDGMVTEAQQAGVDGFVVSWEGARHGGAVDLLAAEAASRPGFLLAPLLELRAMSTPTLLGRRFDPGVAADAARDFLRRVDDTTELRVGGRPVLVTFGMWDLTAAQWDDFRRRVADLNPFIVGDRAASGFSIDGYYHYDPNHVSIDDLEARYETSVDHTRLAPALVPGRRQLLWAATASPGYDTRSWTLLFGRYTDRADGWRYDQTWRAALRTDPDWVFVTSWNEWYEQTHISPGTTTGRRALEQTANWSTRFAAAD